MMIELLTFKNDKHANVDQTIKTADNKALGGCCDRTFNDLKRSLAPFGSNSESLLCSHHYTSAC